MITSPLSLEDSLFNPLIIQYLLASFCKIDKIDVFLKTPSSRQTNADRRRYYLSQATTLQALEPVDCTIEGSFGRSIRAEDSV